MANVPFFFDGERKVFVSSAANRTDALAVENPGAHYQEIGGSLYESNGSAWNPVRISGAGVVTEYSLPADFHALITPTISGTPTPEIEIDGAGSAGYTGVPNLLRITMNPGDDLNGATRLQNGYPEVFWCLPGESIFIPSESAITDIYLVGVDYVTAAGTYTGTTGIISRNDATLANWLANMVHFNLNSSNNARGVIITMSPLFNTNYARAKVEAVSYA